MRFRVEKAMYMSSFISTYAQAKEAVIMYYVTFSNNTVATISEELVLPSSIVNKILRDYFEFDNKIPEVVSWKVRERLRVIHALEAYNESAPETEQVNI